MTQTDNPAQKYQVNIHVQGSFFTTIEAKSFEEAKELADTLRPGQGADWSYHLYIMGCQVEALVPEDLELSAEEWDV